MLTYLMYNDPWNNRMVQTNVTFLYQLVYQLVKNIVRRALYTKYSIQSIH